MTHEDRVWHHEMETLEGIHEHAERIASLEELVLDWLTFADARCYECRLLDAACVEPSSYRCHLWDACVRRMRELGIEVGEDG